MFERRRSIWVLILALYLCILIWRISVQDVEVDNVYATNLGEPAAATSTAQQWNETSAAGGGIKPLEPKRRNINYAADNHDSVVQNEEVDILQFNGQNVFIEHATVNSSMPKYKQNASTSLTMPAQGTSRLIRTASFKSTSYISNSSSRLIRHKSNYESGSSSTQRPAAGGKPLAAPPSPLPPLINLYALKKPASTAFAASLAQPPPSPPPDSNDIITTVFTTTTTTLTNLEAKSSSLMLPLSDYGQLIDLTNFAFLTTQPACSAHIKALILVHSAPQNRLKRALIRNTWASILQPKSALRLLFLLGRLPAATTPDEQHDYDNDNDVDVQLLQQQLLLENAKHGDIVQGSFVDAYRNMTYKHVMAFKWFLYNCPSAQLLIKVDDDIFVNTPQILSYLNAMQQAPSSQSQTLSAHKSSLQLVAEAAAFNSTLNLSQLLFEQPQELMFCDRQIGSKVKRSYRSKWRVSYSEYAQRYYPPYCPGYAIIYSRDVALRLYKAAQSHAYFWIDDVHITGIMAQQTNSSITNLHSYVLNHKQYTQLLANKTLSAKLEFLFSWPDISAQQIRKLWSLVSNKSSEIIIKQSLNLGKNNSYKNSIIGQHKTDMPLTAQTNYQRQQLQQQLDYAYAAAIDNSYENNAEYR